MNVFLPENAHIFSSKLSPLMANEYLYQQGERSSDLYRICAGIVGLESVNERGERCIFHLLGRGTVLGHEIFLKQPRSLDARACTDALVEVISLLPTPESKLDASQMHWANAAVARLLQDAARFRVELHRAQATEKVLLLLEHLKHLQPETGGACWLPSRNEMADILDINHATASRIVAHLFREGTLRRTARKEFVHVEWSRISSLRGAR